MLCYPPPGTSNLHSHSRIHAYMKYADDSSHSYPVSPPSITSPPLGRSWTVECPDVYTSPSSSASSIPLPSPVPQRRARKTHAAKANPTHSSRRCSPSYIPRPRNAFMIFRSDFYNRRTIDATIEHDHRHISRIIGCCWRKLGKEEKRSYKERAQEEADLHKLKYPDYRFQPVHRKLPVQRRNVKRNGAKDKIRCQGIADFIAQGKSGSELHTAIKELDAFLAEYGDLELNTFVASPSGTGSNHRRSASPRSESSHPAFRSPPIAPVAVDLPFSEVEEGDVTVNAPASLVCIPYDSCPVYC